MDSDVREVSRFEVHATSSDHFSWLRTRMSAERTLMSWVRTSISLIGFGFTIVQFFQRFTDAPGIQTAAFPAVPRYLGLTLIGVGTGALALALWEYVQVVAYLWSRPFLAIAGLHKAPSLTPVPVVASVVLLIGFFILVAIITRLI